MLLFNLDTESKILTFVNTNGRVCSVENYSMKTSYNKNIFYLNEKIYMIKMFFIEYKSFCLNENIIRYHENIGDIRKIYFIKYKVILIEGK